MNNQVVLIEAKRFSDTRGWFSETYSRARYAGQGVDLEFVQDNQSYSAVAGTIRGIHFQTAPHAQAKLVRCTAGAIMDYAVDLRRSSPTYGKWVGAELSRDNGRQLFIPIGFGHAFVTLAADTEVSYKVSDYYAPECDGGIIWNDPDVAIDWPAHLADPVLSQKDLALSTLGDFKSGFTYDGMPLKPMG